jgi:hypothetical protein
MHEIERRCPLNPRLILTGVALLVILAAKGCERPPNTGNDPKPPPQDRASTVKPAGDTQAPLSPTTTPAQTEPPVDATQPVAAGQAADAERNYIAYYFHRTIRCATCLSIEKQSREAIEMGYGGELSAGRLEWRAVNIEEPGNEHFEKDFELDRQSLVLVEMLGDQVKRWKTLPRVWELVEDPYGFQQYVVTAVAEFLGG